MDLRKLIINTIKKQGQLKTSDIVKKTGLSRAYVHRFLKSLSDEGKIVLIGKANQAHYIFLPNDGNPPLSLLKIHKIIKNKEIDEDKVLKKIKNSTSIFQSLAKNISSIIDYAFTEMLNNAIEHSESNMIDIVMYRTTKNIVFTVLDRGIGIFKNIMRKRHLNSEIDAIQELLKGKETTAPKAHSGEGIFFTSKISDFFTIKSFGKMLVFDNIIKDLYVKDIKSLMGTRVEFTLSLKSKKVLSELFGQYTDDSYQFSKTGVKVKLYTHDVEYVSRSQARRLLTGLDKFKTIELDFKDVSTIGQGFADEVFRIWQNAHQNIKLTISNANENIMFMINRSKTK